MNDFKHSTAKGLDDGTVEVLFSTSEVNALLRFLDEHLTELVIDPQSEIYYLRRRLETAKEKQRKHEHLFDEAGIDTKV